MSFSQKVHHILSNPEYEQWISWMPHGRAFKVHVPVVFESKILPQYFGHKRHSSFLRELDNYGFKHITRGPDRNCKYLLHTHKKNVPLQSSFVSLFTSLAFTAGYYHELMLKDRPHLCQFMPKAKDARRLVADPTNEPNFYKISQEYPLSSNGEDPPAATILLHKNKNLRPSVLAPFRLCKPHPRFRPCLSRVRWQTLVCLMVWSTTVQMAMLLLR